VPVTETTLTSGVFDQLRLAMAADPAAFTGLYRDFLADARESWQVLREGVQAGQVESVRAKAHYLKSSSLVLGAPVVARYAAMLEESAIQHESEKFGSLLAEVEKALQDVQAELTKRLGAGVIPADETAA